MPASTPHAGMDIFGQLADKQLVTVLGIVMTALHGQVPLQEMPCSQEITLI